MSPHPDEIAWVLAASEAVREALRGVSGPGWAPFADGWQLFDRPDPEDDWLPVSEVAIAAEAARRAGCQDYVLLRVDDDEAPPDLRHEAHTYGQTPEADGWGLPVGVVRGFAPTARLAALRLLAAVVEGA